MIIALCGLKGSGKTTLAKKLAQSYRRQPFANPFYLMAETLLAYQGATEEEISYLFNKGKEEPTEYLNGKSVRHALQALGTEWGRDCIGKDIWIDVWERNFIKDGRKPTVIEDMRFLNEAKVVKRLGGVLVRIERPGVELDPRHISELEQLRIQVDHTIVNDGEPKDMLRELNHFLHRNWEKP